MCLKRLLNQAFISTFVALLDLNHSFRYKIRQPCSPLLQFSKEALADMYSAYIDNFLNARDAVRIAKEAKPAFHKFLEVSHGD